MPSVLVRTGHPLIDKGIQPREAKAESKDVMPIQANWASPSHHLDDQHDHRGKTSSTHGVAKLRKTWCASVTKALSKGSTSHSTASAPIPTPIRMLDHARRLLPGHKRTMGRSG